MFNTDFDPLKCLEDLQENQKILFNNDRQIAQGLQMLEQKIKEQQEVIDVLIKGLDAANKANQQLLSQGLDRLYTSFQQGQH